MIFRSEWSISSGTSVRGEARRLGFVRDTVATPIKSAINAAIRRGILGGNQKLIWREEQET